jgi:glycosyltransferase involved in cell wall biosynthesis
LIASDVGVLPDVVLDRVTGALIPANSEQDLANAVAELCTTWPRARAWGAAARERMVKEFHEDRYAEKLVKVLYQAVESARTKAPG